MLDLVEKGFYLRCYSYLCVVILVHKLWAMKKTISNIIGEMWQQNNDVFQGHDKIWSTFKNLFQDLNIQNFKEAKIGQ